MAKKSSDAKELAAARAVVRGHLGDVPAVWSVAVAKGEVPAVISDNHRWSPPPRYGRDPTTGRALRKDGTPVRSGRPPGTYTANGSASGQDGNYANSHKKRKYRDSGSYSKTIMQRVAEALAKHS